MLALIGLGNPGQRYINTRHNIGYLVVDQLSAFDKIPFKAGKGDYYYKNMILDGESILIVKPTTFMNRSGIAVGQILDYFPVSAEDLLIVCDDYNLPFGTFRFRKKGTHGGHNGLKSIIYHLQTEEFYRFRIGIGNAFSDAVDYVLKKFNKEERKYLDDLLPISTDAIRLLMAQGIDVTMNKYNRSFMEDNQQ